MKWLKRRLRDWFNRDDCIIETSPMIKKSSNVISLDDEGLRSQPFRLKVYNANGGIIVETSKYDSVKDRNFNGLHIITHDQELGESLAKIITMESLRG
jgi:hypothetical protein